MISKNGTFGGTHSIVIHVVLKHGFSNNEAAPTEGSRIITEINDNLETANNEELGTGERLFFQTFTLLGHKKLCGYVVLF